MEGRLDSMALTVVSVNKANSSVLMGPVRMKQKLAGSSESLLSRHTADVILSSHQDVQKWLQI